MKPFRDPQRAVHSATKHQDHFGISILDDLLGSKEVSGSIPESYMEVLLLYLTTTTSVSAGNPSLPLPLTEDLEAELHQEGRRTLGKERRQQTRGNKQVGGIRSTWALWECQLGRTKAICETAK